MSRGLGRCHLARLACCRDDHPYVVPITYDFDGEHLYGFATLGQKIVWMRQNPNVCVEVDDVEDRFHWTTVLVFGRMKSSIACEHEQARERARRLFEQREEWWQPAAAKAGPPEHHVPVIYRVAIGRSRTAGRSSGR